MNQVALISGCDSGFVLEIARALVERGFDLAVMPRDVANEDAACQFVRETEKRAGPISLLVNTCGAGTAGATRCQHQLEAALTIPLLCSRAVIPAMTARKHGLVVNVLGQSRSLMAAALIELTEALGNEVRTLGVNVFTMRDRSLREWIRGMGTGQAADGFRLRF